MHTVIKRRTGFAHLELADLWRNRELIGFLAWRDIAVRYKQTLVGVGWAFVRPFLTMVVFTVVFGHLAKLPSERVPYAILTFTALLPWQFFASAFAEVSNSVVGSGHMLTKIYFPRLILPITSVAVSAVDFLVSLGLLFLLMLHYRVAPAANIVLLPLFVVLGAVCTLGLGLWFAALHVKYRDVRHFVPFITQLGIYVSPVAFSTTIIPERWRLLYSLNPMVAVIDGFRWCILGTTPLYVPGLFMSIVISLILLISGVVYFKNTERDFADLI